MLPFKTVLLKLALFIAVYGLLIGFFKIPSVRAGVSSAYAKSAQWFLKKTLTQGYFVTEIASSEGAKSTSPEFVSVLFGNKAQLAAQATAAAAAGRKDTNLALQEFRIKFEEFFLFSALFFLALVLLSPIKWLKKLKMAGLGLAFLLFFSWLKLDAYALHHFAQMRMGVYELTGWKLNFVTKVFLNLKVGIGYILATATWAFLLFRQADWRSMMGDWTGKSGE
jgi:hypothetical protein